MFLLVLIPVFFLGIFHVLFLFVGTVVELSRWLGLLLEADFDGKGAIRVSSDVNFSLALVFSDNGIGIGVSWHGVVVLALRFVHLTHVGVAVVSWRLVVRWLFSFL